MIQFIKDDGTYFYVITEKGRTYFMSKNRAQLMGYNERTWTIKRDNYVTTYDERGNIVGRHNI